MNRRNELHQIQRAEALTSVVRDMGGNWSTETIALVIQELAPVSDSEFDACMRLARLECAYVPRPVDFISRCPSMRWQTADEAWASVSSMANPVATEVVTDLSRIAYKETLGCHGDDAHRRAFCAVYGRLVNEWKALGRKPQWVVSEGSDQVRKLAAIREGVRQGKLRASDYRALLAPPAEPKQSAPAPQVQHATRAKTVELTDEDIELIERIHRSDSETVHRDATQRLGPDAVAKLLAYALRNSVHKAPSLAEVQSASADDCYESCGRKAVAGSSRCASCARAVQQRYEARRTERATA